MEPNRNLFTWKAFTTERIAQRNIDKKSWQDMHDIFGIEFMRTVVNDHFRMEAEEENMSDNENLKQVILAKLEK